MVCILSLLSLLQAVVYPSAVCHICGLSGSHYSRGAAIAPLAAVEKLSFGSEHLSSDCVDESTHLSNGALENGTISDVGEPNTNDAVCLSARIHAEDLSMSSAISEAFSDYSKEDFRKSVDSANLKCADLTIVKLESSGSQLNKMESVLWQQDLQLQTHSESRCLTMASDDGISEDLCGKQLNELQEGSENGHGCKQIPNNSSGSGYCGTTTEKLESVEQNGEDYLISCACCGVSGKQKCTA